MLLKKSDSSIGKKKENQITMKIKEVNKIKKKEREECEEEGKKKEMCY